MKKIILSLILLILSITLISCGLTEQEKTKVELYDKYKDLISALESKDNAAATQELLKITQSNSSGQSTTETEDESATAEKWMKEIVGTWYEMNGMFDDITFRDDATCTYDGNTYSVEFDSKNGSVIKFNLKNEEKVIYIGKLYGDYADNNTSHDLILWEIIGENTQSQRGLYICSADYNAQKDEWMDKIFGTWYAMYSGIDITFREDGTCAYDGKTYSVEFDFTGGDSVQFLLKDGETTAYEVILFMDYANNGTFADLLLIERINENRITTIGNFISSADHEKAEAEAKAEAEKLMNMLVGDWISADTSITVNNDGTCIIGETTYTVRPRLDYYTNSTIYFYLYNGNTKEYELDLAKDFENNGVDADIILRPTKGSSIKFCRASDFEAIELTVDNWLNYFEIEEYSSFVENSFGEVENVQIGRYYSLKNEYIVNPTLSSSIAIEYTTVNYGAISCSIDPINRTYTTGEMLEKWTEKTTTTEMNFYSDGPGFNFTHEILFPDEFENGYLEYADGVVMNRIKGTLYILK